MNDDHLLHEAASGISAYLLAEQRDGRITGSYYADAVAKTLPALRKWLRAEELDAISPGLRGGLRTAIREQRWEALVNAYARDVSFGTGGIREKMGSNRDEVLRLKHEGIHAPIIKGPNTINDVVYLLTAAGTAKFGLEHKPPFSKVVVGFDSRVRGSDFARLIAGQFLAYGYTVYLFDEACLYPSVTYAVPTLKADIGVFISASHNDFRYNGYKLSCRNGSQFDPAERDILYKNYITKVQFNDIRIMPLTEAPRDKLWFLGGISPRARRVITGGEHAGLPLADPLADSRDVYAGREDRIIDLHTMHINHIKQFILRGEMITNAKHPLSIGYCAFNGSGRKAVPRLLSEVGFVGVKRIMKLDALDGMFPAFCSDPGKEQQPDPGDWRAADIAVVAFKSEYGPAWNKVDLIIGTDPDADRCGVIVKVPLRQRPAYLHPGTGQPRDYALISADDLWSLILWYRLNHEIERYGKVQDVEKRFIVLSHTTTDMLARLARKHGLGVLTTWVGFAQLAAGTRMMWDSHEGKDTHGITERGRLPVYTDGRRNPDDTMCNRMVHSWEGMDDPRRCINVAALEQSNGFSLLGGVPRDERSLGVGGHVRDKDGTLAAVLVAELSLYAKEQGTNLLDLLDEKLYLDADIGLYITYYEPDPIDGEYEGLAGYTKKRAILDRAEALYESHEAIPTLSGQAPPRRHEGALTLGGLAVAGATVYRTGKYDAINWAGFPDEGYRFFLEPVSTTPLPARERGGGEGDRRSHLTIRPSGTSNALRFHVQLFGGHPARNDLIARKAELRATAASIVGDIRNLISADK